MPAAELSFEIIREEEPFLALGEHWDALLAQSAVRTPFLSWDWVRLWWLHSSPGFKLCVGVLREAGMPVGIAPLCLGRAGKGGRRLLRCLSFLGGHGPIASEGLDFIMPAGREAELMPLLWQTVTRTQDAWDVVDLPCMWSNSATVPLIERSLAAFKYATDRMLPMEGLVLRLPATWEAQMASFSAQRRQGHKAKWKKFMAQHQACAFADSLDLSSDLAMDTLLSLHRHRFNAQQSSFLDPVAMAFHQDLAALWQPQGRLVMTRLEAHGRIAAMRYGFIFDGRQWDYQSGFDPIYSALSLGSLNMGWAVQSAIGRGLKEFDHLAGDESHKKPWSDHSRWYRTLEAFHPTSPAALLFHSIRLVRRLSLPTLEATAPVAALCIA